MNKLILIFWLMPALFSCSHRNEQVREQEVGEEVESNNSCGPGDASCEQRVTNHINGINGVEVNFISYIQNNDGSPSGKFSVGFLKQDERGINQYSATIATDCHCNVIDASGISSQ
jgi:hypothetical protein